MTATINGREYTVETHTNDEHPNYKAMLKKNGWDGNVYLLTGKRGATYMATRTPDGRWGSLQSI